MIDRQVRGKTWEEVPVPVLHAVVDDVEERYLFVTGVAAGEPLEVAERGEVRDLLNIDDIFVLSYADIDA